MKYLNKISSLYKKKKRFYAQFQAFKQLSEHNVPRFEMNWNERFPVYDEATSVTEFDRHYVYHPAWAIRILRQTQPEEHTDISSILSFATSLSAFIPVKFYDYRPAKLSLSNLTCEHADLKNLSFADNSVRSLSCMHTVEHVGLGRYGDVLDYDGDLVAMQELQRVLAVGGDLLFVVPVGKPRILFNAHRIYSYSQIIAAFGALRLVEFSLIPDRDEAGRVGIIKDATEALANRQHYGCGCFWFKK